jgi:predicted RNase H-like HicB family nuclease
MLMPLLDDKFSMFRCKLLRLRQLSHFQALRFAQLDPLLHIEYSLPSAVSHMDVNRPMLVTIKEEPVAVLLKNLRHPRNLTIHSSDGDFESHPARCSLARAQILWRRISMPKASPREFSVVLEQDEDGYYIASPPELPGCHTQARSPDKVMARIQEAIELCLQVEDSSHALTKFIGVQRVTVA